MRVCSVQQLTSSSASSSPASSSSSSRSLPSTSSSSASTSGSSSSTSSAGSGSVLRFLVLGAVHIVVRKMSSCHIVVKLAIAQGTYEQQPQHPPPPLLPPPQRRHRHHPRWQHQPHRPRKCTCTSEKTSVIVVRRMRRARSHWDGRCDGWGSIAREQASRRRMRPGLRGLRP